MDYGERVTEKQINSVNKKLRATYRTAQKELEAKLAEFNRKFAEKDRRKQAQLAAGEITQQAYKDWLAGQVFMRGQWQTKLNEVCNVLHTSNVQAAKIVQQGKLDVFSENYNYTAYVAERKTGVSFDIYNTSAVAKLVEEDPQTLPEWKIDEKKDYVWNKQKVNNSVMQGIIQGEGIDKITKRLCEDLATKNESKMRLFARTAMTGAQNAGRQQHMEEAAKMGITQKKRWVATLDKRTRDAHRYLDGQEVPIDEPFKSILGDIDFPGDPHADPANTYNCRCRIVTIYPKYEDYSKPDWREAEIIEGQSYRKWKEVKTKSLKSGTPDTMSLIVSGRTEKPTNKYGDEMKEKGYVGLSGSESDKFMKEHHNKRIIGKHGENTMDGGQSRRINEALRKGEMPTAQADVKMVERLDKEIASNKLPEDMTLFRGTSLAAFEKTGVFEGFTKRNVPMADFKKANGDIDFDAWGKAFQKATKENLDDLLSRAKGLVGKEVTDDGFMQVSVSSERNIFQFSDINIQLHAPSGTNAYISDYLSESEVILGRGTTIRIVDAEIATVKSDNGTSMEIIQLIAEIEDKQRR